MCVCKLNLFIRFILVRYFLQQQQQQQPHSHFHTFTSTVTQVQVGKSVKATEAQAERASERRWPTSTSQ